MAMSSCTLARQICIGILMAHTSSARVITTAELLSACFSNVQGL